MSGRPTLPDPSTAAGSAPGKAAVSLRSSQAIFELECSNLSNLKALGQAPGEFPASTFPSLGGTFFWFVDEAKLAQADQCWLWQESTILSAATSLCIGIGAGGTCMGFLAADNPPAQNWQSPAGTAQVFFS